MPDKARALIGLLAACKGRAVSRDRLADLLWPERQVEQARHSLRNCLLQLRKVLGPAAADLVADRASCRLGPAIVDLDSFERLAGSRNREDLRAAAALFRGAFLADLAVRSQPFEEWLRTERERLLALASDVLARLAGAEAAAGEHDAAIRSARRLVALDPLAEPAQRALMRAYAQAGRRPEALRQYRNFADILKRELAVPPDAETRALANAIARVAGARGPEFGLG